MKLTAEDKALILEALEFQDSFGIQAFDGNEDDDEDFDPEVILKAWRRKVRALRKKLE